jgi:tetratricopeptide (TPR) repeat protein
MENKKRNNEFYKFLQILFNGNDFAGVVKESNAFMQNNGEDSVILNFLGLSYYRLKNFDSAILTFIKALGLDKNNFSIQYNLSEVYLAKNCKFSALKSSLQAIKINKTFLDSYLKIYNLLNNQFSKKKILIRLSKNINFSEILIPSHFLSFIINNYEYDFGIFVFKKLIKKQPTNYSLHNIVGQLYFLNGMLEEATLSQKKSIELKNDYYSAYYDLAEIQKAQGDFVSSKVNYKKAISYNTNSVNGELHRSFSSIHKYQSLLDEHLVQMKSLLETETVEEQAKTHIKFALAKAYEDILEYDKSVQILEEANTEYYQSLKYSSEFISKEIDILKNFYIDHKAKAENKDLSFTENVPIFIIGLPRSGSTLVEQIVSSHPKVVSYGESKIFGHNLSKFFNVQDFALFNNQLNKVSNKVLYQIGKEYCKTINEKSNHNFFTDKMLFNFCYLGLIKICLPGAKIIYCARDYRDIFVSIYKNYFSEPKMGFAYNKNELLEFIHLFNSTISFWSKELNDSIFNLHYENLVKQPKIEVTKMLEFCGLDWNDQCLNFYNKKSDVRTVSSSQVRQNFYASSVRSWKNYSHFFTTEFNKLEVLMNQSK